MQCLKRSKSEPDKGLVIAIAVLVRNAGIAPNRSQADPFPGGAIAQVEGDWICFK